MTLRERVERAEAGIRPRARACLDRLASRPEMEGYPAEFLVEEVVRCHARVVAEDLRDGLLDDYEAEAFLASYRRIVTEEVGRRFPSMSDILEAP